MSDNTIMELHKQHREGQQKYTYFLLAAAASAVAFSVQKTTGCKLTWSMLPLGLAVLCWGFSFYCGCRYVSWVQTSIFANYSLLQLQNGVHPEQPNHPEVLQAALEGVRSAVKSNIDHAAFHGAWQFRLLVIGAVLFLYWHISVMATVG